MEMHQINHIVFKVFLIIYVKVCIKKIPNYLIKKKIQTVLLVSKLFLNCFYATFKQWLQEVKSPYTYFSLIRLTSNFVICT
jgi:hypothetical protein